MVCTKCICFSQSVGNAVPEPSGKPGKHVSNKRGLWLFIPLASDKAGLSSAVTEELKWGFTEIRDGGDPQGSSSLC